MEHLKTLKWLNFAIGAYTFVFGLLFLVMFVLPGLIGWGEGEEMLIVFVLVGLLAFVLLGGLGLAHVVVGYLVGAQRGRIAQTVLAVTQLTSFPVGTGYALYALWVCWIHEPSKRSFSAAIRPPITR